MEELIEASTYNLMGIVLGSNYYLDLLVGMRTLYCHQTLYKQRDVLPKTGKSTVAPSQI